MKTTDKTSEQTIIRECVCDHAFQDSRYGKSMRVMNPTKKTEGNKQLWRCTVCGRTHTK